MSATISFFKCYLKIPFSSIGGWFFPTNRKKSKESCAKRFKAWYKQKFNLNYWNENKTVICFLLFMYAANIAIWVERTIFWIRQKDIQPIARMYNSTLPNIPYILARAPGIHGIKLQQRIFQESELHPSIRLILFSIL